MTPDVLPSGRRPGQVAPEIKWYLREIPAWHIGLASPGPGVRYLSSRTVSTEPDSLPCGFSRSSPCLSGCCYGRCTPMRRCTLIAVGQVRPWPSQAIFWVAISGKTVIVGAPGVNGVAGNDSGAAFLSKKIPASFYPSDGRSLAPGFLPL